MDILSSITDKIKSSNNSSPKIKQEKALPGNGGRVIDEVSREIPVKAAELQSPANFEDKSLDVLKNIYQEISTIADIVRIRDVKKQTKQEVKTDIPSAANKKTQTSQAKKEKKAKLGVLLTPKEEAVEASKKDGVREASSEKTRKRKEKDAERIQKSREKAAAPIQKEAPAPVEPTQEPPKEDKKGLLDGLIDMLKNLFLPILAVGGIGAFLGPLFTSILEGLGFDENQEGFFGTLIKTIKTITKPVFWVFDNVIKPLGSTLLVIIKEGLLGLGQSWNEMKLFLMGNSFFAKGLRALLGFKVDKKEEEALKREVYEGRKRKEERMAGYIEKVTGKKPPPPAAIPIAAETKPAAQAPKGQQPAVIPTPTVTEPAPTPAVAAAPPPPVTRAPAPTPAPAAAPAGPPPAPSIKPTEPTLKPAAPPAQGGVQGLIIQSLKESGITDQKAIANILATVKAESNFQPRSENLNYTSAERIVQVFGAKRTGGIEGAQSLVKNPEALANKVYATTDGNSAEGDGWKYRGRGFIQHTGKNQYKAISQFTGLDLIGNPDLLNDPGVAAKAIAWFFLKYKKLSVDQLSNMATVNKAVAFADPTGKKAAEREALASSMYQQMGGATMVAQAPTTGQAINVASAEVGSEKARSRQPTVNVTYVDATKVTTATKTVYS